MHLSSLNAAARVAQAVARALAVGGAPLKISEAVARSEPRLFRALFPGWISKPHTVFPDIHDKNRSEFVRSQWMKDARDLREFIKRSGIRGKRWTVPDNIEDSVSVADVSSTSKPVLEEQLGQIAAFHTPPPPITMDGKDFSSFHAFHRSESNVLVENNPAKNILLSIRSEIRKEESVLSSTRKYLGPKGCLSFLVVQTIASLEQKASKIDADGDGKVDLHELREFLSENGALELFGANSVQEVMAIFDSDGNGTLEPEELSLLMEFIQDEKAKMLAMGENKDSVASGEGAAEKQRIGAINLLDRKRLQITKIEQHLSATDLDGDGNVDLEELRVFLETTGTASFFGASAKNAAEEVMKMFDSDGNGYLDAEEFGILRDFIETEKQMLLATQQ